MSMMLKIVVLITGIIVLLNLGGVETNTGGLVKGFLNGGLANFGNSQVWNDFLNILTLIGFTGAVASIFGRSPAVEWVLAGLVSVFGGLILFDLIGIYTLLWGLNETWIRGIASAIFIPLTIGFFIVIIKFWRGND